MQENKYQVILDNLLDITQNDASIFTKLSENNCVDIYNLLRLEDFKEVLNKEKFEISLLDGNLIDFIDQVKNTYDFNSLKSLLESKANKYIRTSKVDFKANFEYEQKNVINFLEHIQQKAIRKWKILDNKVTSILDETNTWPLHIGFLFVSLRKDDKVIYAPMFFKEVQIKFKNTIPYLFSDGDIKVNEKLIFFLNNSGFNLNIDSNFENFEINAIFEKLKTDWNNLFTLPNDLYDKFTPLRSDLIINENLMFHKGMLLGIFQPWGGYSRNRMKEIINNDEINDIFKVEFDKNKYKNKVIQLLKNENISLFNVAKSNLSQDKAVLSALQQNTIIWGPPGTGKSQTIVNLITNILIYGKKVIVASQKKAALDVINERLGILSKFCLFLLNYKDVKKKKFYQPIQEYLDMLENFDSKQQLQKYPVISQQESRHIVNVNNILNQDGINQLFQAYYYLYKYKMDVDLENDPQFINDLPKDIIYPSSTLQEGKVAKSILKENNSYFLFFMKKYWKIRDVAKQIENKLSNFSGSLYRLINNFHSIKNVSNSVKYLNRIINESKNINFDQQTLSAEIVKNITLERYVKQIKEFNPQLQRLYREFSQSVRIQNLEPYRFVKKYAEMIKLIFPVIVATPDTDLSAWNKEEFDYAILDESSQIFIEKGLPILYLAKTKILAGDKQQMRPSNWFGSRNTDDTIFGKVDSLLDYALSLGVYQIILDKNYRAKNAALMTFSSKYFYQSTLDVVDNASASDENSVEVYQVDGNWEDNHNKVEAQKALQLLNLNLDKYNKIILLAFNSRQSDYLTNLIYSYHPNLEAAINQKKLLIRNIENIQGDEADLVIATISYDKSTKLNSTYVSRSGGSNALNVAISRAKEKMIVIKTIKADDIQILPNSSDDLIIFKKWLQFLERDADSKRELLKETFASKKLDSSVENQSKVTWFKELVKTEFEDIIKGKHNYELFTKYNIGSLDIDLVITKNEKPYKCVLFDTFEYGENAINGYLAIRDKFRFLKAKKYDVIVINPINWITMQNQISLWFDFDEVVSENQPTNTYILNKTNIFVATDADIKLTSSQNTLQQDQNTEVKKVTQQINYHSIEEDKNDAMILTSLIQNDDHLDAELHKIFSQSIQTNEDIKEETGNQTLDVKTEDISIPDDLDASVAVIGKDEEVAAPVYLNVSKEVEFTENEIGYWDSIGIKVDNKSTFDNLTTDYLYEDPKDWIMSNTDEISDEQTKTVVNDDFLKDVDEFTKTVEMKIERKDK
ncbi:DEAD/DEAH box helicase [Mycoplasma sp. AC1221]